jgi:hypothetical protein
MNLWRLDHPLQRRQTNFSAAHEDRAQRSIHGSNLGQVAQASSCEGSHLEAAFASFGAPSSLSLIDSIALGRDEGLA